MKTIQFLGTCSDPEIAEMAEKYGRPSSYKNSCKVIKINYPDIHYSLGMEFYNPWEDNTNIKVINGERILHIVHSQIDYLFKIIE